MGFFIEESFAAEAATDAAPALGGLPPMVMPLIILAVFYFLLIRPQQKRAKEHKSLISNIAKGDEVVTTAGIIGKIPALKDDYISLQINGETELTLQKSSVAATLPAGTISSIKI